MASQRIVFFVCGYAEQSYDTVKNALWNTTHRSNKTPTGISINSNNLRRP